MSAATLTTEELQADTGGLSVADKARRDAGMEQGSDGMWYRPGESPAIGNALTLPSGETIAQRDRRLALAARAAAPTLADQVAQLVEASKSEEQLAAERHARIEAEREKEMLARSLEAEVQRTREIFIIARDRFLEAAPTFAETVRDMNETYGAMLQAGHQAFDRAGLELGAPPLSVARISQNDPDLRRVLYLLQDRTVA